MAITLTRPAAERVRAQLTARGSGQGLRIGVKKSGCSGYAYKLDYATEIKASDQVFLSHEVQVIVDAKHLDFLRGLEVDYVEDGFSSTFHFNNPNVTEQCGCGESFTVE